MDRITHKLKNQELRHSRVRSRIHGTEKRPRLSVSVSNRHITAQLINDDKHETLGYVTTAGKKAAKGSMTERAVWVGKEIAGKAKTAKIKTVVFDRGSSLYHGRVKALADAARESGLEF